MANRNSTTVLGPWEEMTPEAITDATRNDYAKKWYLFEIPRAAFGSSHTMSDLIPSASEHADTDHVLYDMICTLLAKTHQLVDERGTLGAVSNVVRVFHSNGFDKSGNRKTHRFWIVYYMDSNELTTNEIEPKYLVEQMIERLQPIKARARVHPDSLCISDSVIKEDCPLYYCLGDGVNRLKHTDCKVSWFELVRSQRTLMRLLERRYYLRGLASQWFQTIFNVNNMISHGVTSLGVAESDGNLARIFYRNEEENWTSLVMHTSEHTTVHELKSLKRLNPMVRMECCFPYVLYHKKKWNIQLAREKDEMIAAREAERSPSVELHAENEVGSDEEMEEEGPRQSQAAESATAMTYEMKALQKAWEHKLNPRDHYELLKATQSNFAASSMNFPVIYMQLIKENEYINRAVHDPHEATKARVRSLMDALTIGSPLISEQANSMLIWHEENGLFNGLDIGLQPNRTTDVDGACLALLHSGFEMLGIRVSHRKTLLSLFACIDTHFHEYNKLKFNLVLSGTPGVGKSFTFDQILQPLFINGDTFFERCTISKYGMFHEKGCRGADCDRVQLYDDVDLYAFTPRADMRGKAAEEQHAQTELMKTMLTSNFISRKVAMINKDTNRREQSVCEVDAMNTWVFLTNCSMGAHVSAPIWTRFHMIENGEERRIDGHVTDEPKTLKELSPKYKEMFEKFQRTTQGIHFVYFVTAKAISCNALADVNTLVADLVFSKLFPSYRTASHRETRARTRYIRLCRSVTLYIRIMQLWFTNSAPFFGKPFDPVHQLPVLEMTLVVSEQIAIFAFTLMRDEWITPIYDDVIDALYDTIIHPESLIGLDGENEKAAFRVIRPNQGEDIFAEYQQGNGKRRRHQEEDDHVEMHWSHSRTMPSDCHERIAHIVHRHLTEMSQYGSITYDINALKDVIATLSREGESKVGKWFLHTGQNQYGAPILIFNTKAFECVRRERGKYIRSRHATFINTCLSAASYEYAVVDKPMLLATEAVSMLRIEKELDRRKLHADSISCIYHQFQQTIIPERTPRSITLSARLPPLKAMRTFAAEIQVEEPVARSHVQRIRENITEYAQKQHLSKIHQTVENAATHGCLIGPWTGYPEESKLERLNLGTDDIQESVDEMRVESGHIQCEL